MPIIISLLIVLFGSSTFLLIFHLHVLSITKTRNVEISNMDLHVSFFIPIRFCLWILKLHYIIDSSYIFKTSTNEQCKGKELSAGIKDPELKLASCGISGRVLTFLQMTGLEEG